VKSEKKPPEAWRSEPVNRKAEGFLQESGLGRLTGTTAALAFTTKDAMRRERIEDEHDDFETWKTACSYRGWTAEVPDRPVCML
jgi:hypothetical protein